MRASHASRPYPASRAEKIALGLSRAFGGQALDRARQRKRRAEALGHHGQIDLYIAVCTILDDRHGVFRRSRDPHAPLLVALPAAARLPRFDAGDSLVIRAA